jgi:phage-related protein
VPVKRSIQFYRTSSGKCPVEEFLDSLSGKAAQKVTWVLQLIEELEIIPEQYLKKLTKDIWECRIQFGGNIFRVLCFFDESVVVLTHGFQKKTRKTPTGETEKAEKCRNDYLYRSKR